MHLWKKSPCCNESLWLLNILTWTKFRIVFESNLISYLMLKMISLLSVTCKDQRLHIWAKTTKATTRGNWKSNFISFELMPIILKSGRSWKCWWSHGWDSGSFVAPWQIISDLNEYSYIYVISPLSSSSSLSPWTGLRWNRILKLVLSGGTFSHAGIQLLPMFSLLFRAWFRLFSISYLMFFHCFQLFQLFHVKFYILTTRVGVCC